MANSIEKYLYENQYISILQCEDKVTGITIIPIIYLGEMGQLSTGIVVYSQKEEKEISFSSSAEVDRFVKALMYAKYNFCQEHLVGVSWQGTSLE